MNAYHQAQGDDGLAALLNEAGKIIAEIQEARILSVGQWSRTKRMLADFTFSCGHHLSAQAKITMVLKSLNERRHDPQQVLMLTNLVAEQAFNSAASYMSASYETSGLKTLECQVSFLYRDMLIEADMAVNTKVRILKTLGFSDSPEMKMLAAHILSVMDQTGSFPRTPDVLRLG